jgi:hypothetical protein
MLPKDPRSRAEAGRDESGTDVGAACIEKQMTGDDLAARVFVIHSGGELEIAVLVRGADVAAVTDAVRLDRVGDQRIEAAIEQEAGNMPLAARTELFERLNAAGEPWVLDPVALSALEFRQRQRSTFGA